MHAQGDNNFGCFQRCGRAAAPDILNFFGIAGKVRQRDCRCDGAGAAFRFKAPKGAERSGAGGCAKEGRQMLYR